METLESVPDKDRKCFRMIGGALVERTIKDVLPALSTNQSGIKKIMDSLLKEYKNKEKEFEEWQTKNNIKIIQQ